MGGGRLGGGVKWGRVEAGRRERALDYFFWLAAQYYVGAAVM